MASYRIQSLSWVALPWRNWIMIYGVKLVALIIILSFYQLFFLSLQTSTLWWRLFCFLLSLLELRLLANAFFPFLISLMTKAKPSWQYYRCLMQLLRTWLRWTIVWLLCALFKVHFNWIFFKKDNQLLVVLSIYVRSITAKLRWHEIINISFLKRQTLALILKLKLLLHITIVELSFWHPTCCSMPPHKT